MTRGHRVGMAQILVEGGRPRANLARADEAVRDAVTWGGKLVVLPECLDLDETAPPPVNWPSRSQVRTLAQAARENGFNF